MTKRTKDEAIYLSEKHGLNPTIPTCYYCGESKNEVALTGRAGEAIAREMGHPDGKMPRKGPVLDMEPCDKCAEWMRRGIIIMEAELLPKSSERRNGFPEVRRGGCLWVMTEEAVKSFMKPGETLNAALRDRWTFISGAAARALGLPRAPRPDIPKLDTEGAG